MSYLADFLHLGSGTECPEKFLVWSGLSLIGAVAGRKLWTSHGDYFKVYPNTYVCMVGTPGSGKSTAMEQAENIFVSNFPEHLVSESIQSREDVLKKMTDDRCVKMWKDDKTQTIHDWRPFYCIVDEMENFVSVDDKKMVGLLVGIYGRASFGTGFKTDLNPNQRIHHPYFSLLACTIPDWMMSSLRMSLFVGGLGRRLIIVHCRKEKDVPFPNKPVDHDETMARIVKHLKEVEATGGPLLWTPHASRWWETWYMKKERKTLDDPILVQFHETKHVQLLKVAILLCLCERPIKLQIDEAHLAAACTLLDDLEKDIVRLTSGIGRNELAGMGARVMEFLETAGGAASEVQLLKFFGRYLRDPEFREVMAHYQTTGELFYLQQEIEGVNRYFYMLPDYYREWEKKQNNGGEERR